TETFQLNAALGARDLDLPVGTDRSAIKQCQQLFRVTDINCAAVLSPVIAGSHITPRGRRRTERRRTCERLRIIRARAGKRPGRGAITAEARVIASVGVNIGWS